MEPYNSILPGVGWAFPASPAPKTVVEVIEYDDKGRVVKRTTTTTEHPSYSPNQPWLAGCGTPQVTS